MTNAAFHGFTRLKTGFHRSIPIPVTHPTLDALIHVTIPTLYLRVDMDSRRYYRGIERLCPALDLNYYNSINIVPCICVFADILI